MKIISDSIAWDGKGYFCRLCGKANYKSLASVKGHLAQCPGKAMQKHGILPVDGSSPAPAQPSLAGGALQVGLSESSYQHQHQQPVASASGDEQLGSRVEQLENEYKHMFWEKNQSGDWFSQNKIVIIISVVALMIYLLSRQSECECPGGEVGKKVSKVDGLGQKTLSKLADRAISKSIDSLFK